MADFEILVLPGSYAASVAATIDILRAAARLAPRTKTAPPAWRIVSPSAGMVPVSGGMQVEAAALPPLDSRSTWIVPGLGIEEPDALAARLGEDDARRGIDAVAGHVARGGQVAASCSAVFVLARAGLLAGRRATTSWWLASELRRAEPRCRVDAHRMVCADGPVATAGAAFAQIDLLLHLLRVHSGVALAEACGRYLLIDGRDAQANFVAPSMLAGGDELVARVVRRIEEALPSPPTIETLASDFAMSPRTLARHVQRATGRSTKSLVQSVRLARARALLESSRLPVDEVAARVGYADATALRRMMRRLAGSSPSRYRSAGLAP